MVSKASPVVSVLGALLAFAGAVFALYFGVVKGIEDSVDADIDEGTEKVLARQVPEGVIDEETGSYRGVTLGDPVATVVRRLGRPDRRGLREVAIPEVLTGSVWAGVSWSCGGEVTDMLAYREVVFVIEDGRVCETTVAGGGWSTTGGIRAGDPVESLTERFGPGECFKTTNDGPFYEQWECRARLDSGIRIHFGADPVTTVSVARPRG